MRSGIVIGLALVLLVPGSVPAQEASPWAEPTDSMAVARPAVGIEADDCLTWTRYETPDLLDTVGGPAALTAMSDGTIVAVGGNGKLVGQALAWSSGDGETWKKSRLAGPKGTGAWDVAAVGDEVYAVGVRQRTGKKPVGLVWRSSDGRTWGNPVTIPGGFLTGVVGTPDGITVLGTMHSRPGVIGGAPTVWTSTDGQDWVATRVGPAGSWVGPFAAASDGTLVYAVDEFKQKKGKPTTSLHLYKSTDGTEWEDPELDAELRKSVTAFGAGAASYGPNGFLVASSPKEAGGAIWQSEDGAMWQRILEPSLPISAFAIGPCGPLAFTNPGINKQGQMKAAEPIVLVSSDGATWNSTSDEAFERAMVVDATMTTDGRVIALGASGILHGVMWVGEPDVAGEQLVEAVSSERAAE